MSLGLSPRSRAVAGRNSGKVTQLAHEEDGEPYRVWKLDCGGAVYLLKEAKEYEAEVYRAILPKVGGSVPALYQTADIDGKVHQQSLNSQENT